MESEMDNREWLNEYSALKQVDTNNPFTVPAGYFDELEQRIISHIYLLEIKPENEGFTVPESYFNELSGNIQSRINIEELGGAHAGFAVPENYFDGLNSDINSRVAIEEIAGSNAGFAVPENYFEDLEQQINSRIAVEEALQHPEPFSVPAGYFEKLNQAILDKTVEQGKTKRDGAVIRKLFATAAFKYAAAACFAVVLGATVLLNQSADNIIDHNSSFLHKQISSLQVSDIQTYLQDDVDANDTQHAVIDEDAPVNDTKLDNALKSLDENTNQ